MICLSFLLPHSQCSYWNHRVDLINDFIGAAEVSYQITNIYSMLIILTATMSWTWPDTLSPIKSTEANLRAHLSWLSLQNRKITEKVEQNRSRFIKMIFKIKLASLIIEQKFPFSHCHKMEGHAIRMQEKLRIYNAHLSHQHFQYNFPILCNHRLAFFTYNARGSNRIINLSDHSLKM